jgi:hypothetical protein
MIGNSTHRTGFDFALEWEYLAADDLDQRPCHCTSDAWGIYGENYVEGFEGPTLVFF